ncbi:MAG: hypothetical protein LBI84_07340 [Propionibacteriaceae bacterium]|jgi:hypothetical protein|nr:hypothetical protein [Propionibacteriaceae bacterium]
MSDSIDANIAGPSSLYASSDQVKPQFDSATSDAPNIEPMMMEIKESVAAAGFPTHSVRAW